MKKCLHCGIAHNATDFRCPTCGETPQSESGFLTFAPSLAHDNSGFKPDYFATLAACEASHFWFRSRNRLLVRTIEPYAEKTGSFLEIGCGTGYVLSGIAAAYPALTLFGCDLYMEGLPFAAQNVPQASLFQMDARHIPYVEEFDTIGAFDVLEHIVEDEQVLQQIHMALKPRGLFLATVPQHDWLWTEVDETACHVRRYSASDLRAKIERAGFQILRSTSFVTALLPAMMAPRLRVIKRAKRPVEAEKTLYIPPFINRLFERIMQGELAMIRSGINLPVGGSLLIVARKP